MPEGWQPRGATPCPRSGEVAERSYPCPRPGVVAGRSHPVPEARGGGQEEQPHVRGQEWQLGGATQGSMAEQAQEGLEELSHIEGQEWWQ